MVYNNFNVIIDSWCLLVPLFLFAWLPLFGISAVDLCNLPTPKTSRIKGVAIFFFPAVFNLAVLKVSSNIIQRFNVCMNENATIPTCSMACLFSQVPAHRRFLLRMLLLPCVLGEFRTQERGDEAAKQIIGLPDTWPELAGGNSNMSLNFHPKIWLVKMNPFWNQQVENHISEKLPLLFNWVETKHPTGLKVSGKMWPLWTNLENLLDVQTTTLAVYVSCFPNKYGEVLKTKCIVRFSELCKHPRACHWTFHHPVLQQFPLILSCILPPRQNVKR